MPAFVAMSTTLRVCSRFTSNGLSDQSIMTEVQPISTHFLIMSRSLPWSRCSTTGTGESSAISRIQPIMALWP